MTIKTIRRKIAKGEFIEKLIILLILASFINLLFPYNGAFASEMLADANRENLGNLRQTTLYDPFKMPVELKVVKTRYISVSAYSSEIAQTDASPFTTATGAIVHDGIIACNFLPHGTKVRFPEYFGDKVFEVQDRMNPRYYYHADIWMDDKGEAVAFGRRVLKIEILKEVPVIKLGELF